MVQRVVTKVLVLAHTSSTSAIWTYQTPIRDGRTTCYVYRMSEDEERSGPFEKQHSDEDILAFVEANEVVTTKEVSEEFGYHMQTARRRLKSLAEEDELKQKDVGKRFVWWLPMD